VRNRHAEQLRAAARVTATWDGRGGRREPQKTEIEALPERARAMIDAQCNNEGGNPFARCNCYAEPARWMVDEAEEQAPRRDLGLVGMSATVRLGVASWLARRSARRRELALK
jgi:hypothetical protein